MERADFIHLVRRSEQASAENSAAYRRGVALFAGLGYAWVVGCLVLASGMLWWLGTTMAHARLRAAYVWGLLAALGLLWSSVRALWIRIEAPEGVPLQRGDAPALFEALDRIRGKIKGPPLHHVVLDDRFNAAIVQRPRFGLFGGARNHLVIGLPLLMALDRQRFLAVLAHEYGHLRGDHGRFAAWVYRARASWSRLHEDLAGSSGIASWLTHGFLSWYFPRFVARSFALAREDEYEADRIARRLLGADAVGDALTEVALKGDWLDEHFWRHHWSLAGREALPVGPFARLNQALRLPLEEGFARASLRRALRRIGDVDDTHPVLRDRMEALDRKPRLPAWSRRPAFELLGATGERYIAHFDRQWCGANATQWKRHHAALQRVRARATALRESPRCGPTELVELAELQARLAPGESVQALYQAALAQAPEHGAALRGLATCLPPAEALREGILERLWGHAPYRWWAAQVAVAALEDDPAHDAKALSLWRRRHEESEEAEERAWTELTEPPFLQRATREDLGEFERVELQLELSRHAGIRRAWLLRKELRDFPSRRAWLLVLELPGLEAEDAWRFCRALESALDLGGPLFAVATTHAPELADPGKVAGPAVYPVRG